eukprot:237436-Rhodomonas_salina.1
MAEEAEQTAAPRRFDHFDEAVPPESNRCYSAAVSLVFAIFVFTMWLVVIWYLSLTHPVYDRPQIDDEKEHVEALFHMKSKRALVVIYVEAHLQSADDKLLSLTVLTVKAPTRKLGEPR